MKGNLIGWRMHCLSKSWTFFNSCCKQSMKRNAREPNGAIIQFGKGWRHPIQSEWRSVNPDGSTHSNGSVWMLCERVETNGGVAGAGPGSDVTHCLWNNSSDSHRLLAVHSVCFWSFCRRLINFILISYYKTDLIRLVFIRFPSQTVARLTECTTEYLSRIYD